MSRDGCCRQGVPDGVDGTTQLYCLDDPHRLEQSIVARRFGGWMKLKVARLSLMCSAT